VVYRELTGGIYFGKKSSDENYTEASDLCLSPPEIERIAHLAFEAASSKESTS
jgi:3-isopropylmalate dehydrogenase